MVGRPKKVINRLVEKWEHEHLLKVMARKIQRAKPTLTGKKDSESWEPLPRPTRPSATPQAKPAPAQRKASSVGSTNRPPVLLVIPVEPAEPLRPKPRLSSSAAADVRGTSSDVSKGLPSDGTAEGDASKGSASVSRKRVPLAAKGELLNRRENRPLPGSVQKTNGDSATLKEDGGRNLAGRSATSAPHVAPKKQAVSAGASSNMRMRGGNRIELDHGNTNGVDLPRSDTSPRQPSVVKRMPSSKIPRPGGTPGEALKHKARQSLRFVGGEGSVFGAAGVYAEGVEEKKVTEGGFERLPSRGRYEGNCEEDFPVHHADSGEFVIRTPSSGIDQPLTKSEEAALEQQAGRVPAIFLQRSPETDDIRTEVDGVRTAADGTWAHETWRGTDGIQSDGNGNQAETDGVWMGEDGYGTALQQEIAGLNHSLEAMKETLWGMNGTAGVLNGRVRGSARSDRSEVSSQGGGSGDDDTCRTGESDDEGDSDGRTIGEKEAGQGSEAAGINKTETRDIRTPSESIGRKEVLSNQNISDLDAQIAQQEQIQKALLHEIAKAESLEEHQKDFLSESQGDWAPVTGEESHVGGFASTHVTNGVLGEDEYCDDFEEGAAAEQMEGHREGEAIVDVEEMTAAFAEGGFDVEGEELLEVETQGAQKASPRVGFLARVSYQVDGVRGSREESLPGSPNRVVSDGFNAQLSSRGTRRVPDMEGLTAEIQRLEQEMQRLKR